MKSILTGSRKFFACWVTLLAILSMGSLRAEEANEDTTAGIMLAPRAFRAAADKILPSVVTIESFGASAQPSAPKRRPRARNRGRGHRRRPRRAAGGIRKPGEGPTTGLIISADGYLVTSTFNFIRKQPIITVTLDSGARHVARLLGRDETRKLCILKIDGVSDLPVPVFVSQKEMVVGQWAVTLGVGFGGDEPALSFGIVSATKRVSGRAVQTDANISPANYGGPLVDIEGRVLGICVPLSPRSQAASGGVEWYDSGIGFAIPLHGNDKIIEKMKAGKTIKPGKLGILPGPGAKIGEGVTIRQVAKDSPAKKAGLKAKDTIIAVNGEPVFDLLALKALLGQFVAGDEVTIKYKRAKKEAEVTVVMSVGVDALSPKNPMPMPKLKRVKKKKDKSEEKKVEKKEEKKDSGEEDSIKKE